MSVKLRFRRMGRRKLPVFGLVATDSRSPRDGRFIEDLGRYEPVAEPSVVKLDAERIVYWLGQGAQTSDTVRNLLQKEGILLRWALTRRGEEAEAIEQAVAEFRERQGSKTPTKKTRADRRAEALEAERKVAKERAAELEKERQEREAELARQREEAEAAERAAAEEARAEAAAAAADSEAMTEATDEPATGGDSETPAAATEGEPVEQTSSQADGDGDTADQQAEAEAEGGDAAVAEASGDAVAEEAPDTAEEQPAAEDTTSEQVAAETGDAVADQAEAGAEESDEVTEAPATEAPDTEGTSGEEAAGDTPPATEEAASADDLTAIHGVGPKYAQILTGAGLTTFSAVAEASVEQLQAAIEEAGSTTAGNEETWPEQARFLAAGDAEGHAAYVESLKSE